MSATNLASTVLAVATVWLALSCHPAVAVDYSYDDVQIRDQARGPSRWGEIIDTANGRALYEQCRFGSAQSPLDITQHVSGASVNPALRPLTDALIAGAAMSINRFTITHDGAQLFLSGFNAVSTFTDPLAEATFELQSIFFRSPSDHSFGGGKRDAEIQFVYAVSSALETAPAVAVDITVSASAFASNAEFQKLLQWIPTPPAIFGDAARRTVSSVPFNPFKWMPPSRRYATYQGSLTFPPCTQEVRRYVFVEPLLVSTSQLAEFRQRMGFNSTERGSGSRSFRGNSRPTQPQRSVEFFLDETVDRDSYFVPSAALSSDDESSLERSIAALVLSGLAAVVALRALLIISAYARQLSSKRAGSVAPSTLSPLVATPAQSSAAKYMK